MSVPPGYAGSLDRGRAQLRLSRVLVEGHAYHS